MTKQNSADVLVDGLACATIPAVDRGFLYGDGLFETMRVRSGSVPLWPYHRRRLQASAQRLGLPLPADETLLDDIARVGQGDCVVRLIVTRGDAEAPGYAPDPDAVARRVVMRLALPAARPPLKTGICRQRLAAAGPGAGLKHLSRLPQVLLANERRDQGWDEALVADDQARLVEATQGNVLVMLGGKWVTPPVGAGVAGVYRQYLCEELGVTETTVEVRTLAQAEALAICNAVRGIEAVSEVAGVASLDPRPALALAEAARR